MSEQTESADGEDDPVAPEGRPWISISSLSGLPPSPESIEAVKAHYSGLARRGVIRQHNPSDGSEEGK